MFFPPTNIWFILVIQNDQYKDEFSSMNCRNYTTIETSRRPQRCGIGQAGNIEPMASKSPSRLLDLAALLWLQFVPLLRLDQSKQYKSNCPLRMIPGHSYPGWQHFGPFYLLVVLFARITCVFKNRLLQMEVLGQKDQEKVMVVFRIFESLCSDDTTGFFGKFLCSDTVLFFHTQG